MIVGIILGSVFITRLKSVINGKMVVKSVRKGTVILRLICGAIRIKSGGIERNFWLLSRN